MKNIAPIMLLLLMIAVGLVQLRLGYLGIEHHLGTLTAVILSIAAFLGVLLPITIGSYFGAVDVMGWPIWVGLLVSVPGLLFATPMIMLNIIQSAVPMLEKPSDPDRSNRPSAASPHPQTAISKHGTVAANAEAGHFTKETEATHHRSDEVVTKEFEKLVAYSSRLAEIDRQLREFPSQYRVEFRRRVLMSSSPLVDAAAIAAELIARHKAILNPFATDELNSYYQQCREFFGENAAGEFVRVMHRLGDAADPHEVYSVIQKKQDEAHHLRLREDQRAIFYVRIMQIFFVFIGIVAATEAILGLNVVIAWFLNFF